MTAAAPPRARFGVLLLLTLVFGGLNALKPLQIDDAAYYYFARQLAAHPFDPYGFNLIWYQEPSHALEILAPPVLPYSWALGLALFGDHPCACKLLLLPWSFLLVWAFHALARRFATGLEMPLTILTILSPALWPSLNLMLDIPALGLTLTAVELFLRACDDDSFCKAACAGLIAGVGFETKYTACTAVAAILLAAMLRRRWALGIVAVLLAAQVFGAWEFVTAVLYDRSHFFLRLAGRESTESKRVVDALQGLVLSKGPLVASLLSLLGGVTPALLLLGLAALGRRRRWLVFTAALFLGGVLAICLFDSHFKGSFAPSERIFGSQKTPPLNFELADVIFAVLGGVLLLVAGMVCRRLYRAESGDARREVLFLVGWLVVETAAYFPLTPFPAVRRILGIFVVVTLLLGRFAARSGLLSAQRRTLYGIVVFGVVLGFALFTLDFRGAEVYEKGAEQSADWIWRNGGDRDRVWYTGHWGFQYYAERNGMKAVIPDYGYDEKDGLPPPTLLKSGDWIVLPDEIVDQQKFQLDPNEVHEVKRLTFDDPIPLRSVPSFHGSPVAVQHQEKPRFQVRIFRVERDFLPKALPNPASEK